MDLGKFCRGRSGFCDLLRPFLCPLNPHVAVGPRNAPKILWSQGICQTLILRSRDIFSQTGLICVSMCGNVLIQEPHRMLIRLKVANFLSIRDEIEFTAEATREANHRARVARGPFPWLKVLPTAAFYGPNGSGKSNLVKAVEFAKLMITIGTKGREPIRRSPFKLRPGSVDTPSRFSFEFLTAQERVFRYEFAVTAERVVSESLTEIRSASERVWFVREPDAAIEGDRFRLPYLDRRDLDPEERQFVRFVARGTRPNQLFLREAADRNLDHFADAFEWFLSQLVVLHPHTRFGPLEISLSERDDLRSFASNALQAADTGIVRIASEEVPLQGAGIPDDLLETIQESLVKEGQGTYVIDPDGKRYGIYFRDGQVRVYRLVTFHRDSGGKEVEFGIDEESDGTARLLDFLPGLFAVARSRLPRTFIIDEIDRSMHPLLTWWFVESFLELCGPEGRAQLIFTCHASHLLDQRLLRRDEIWLVEKTDDGATEIEPLSDYGDVRIDTDIRKGYLHGVYSGVPHLKHLGFRASASKPVPEEEAVHGGI